MAHTSLLALPPAVALGLAAAGAAVVDDPAARATVVERVNGAVGTAVVADTGRLGAGHLGAANSGAANSDTASAGIVSLGDLLAADALRASAALAAVLLLLAAVAWWGATREGVRAVFGGPSRGVGPRGRAGDLPGLVLGGPPLLVATLAGLWAAVAPRTVGELLGFGDPELAGVLVPVGVVVPLVLVDACALWALLRWSCGVRIPRGDLLPAAALGGLLLGGVTVGGGLVLGVLILGVLDGPPAVVALCAVLWVLLGAGLFSRCVLLAASWAAERAARRGHLPVDALARGADGDGSAVSGEPSYLRPSFGARSQDRVTLGAGIVLGAASVLGLGTLRGAGRALAGPRRRGVR